MNELSRAEAGERADVVPAPSSRRRRLTLMLSLPIAIAIIGLFFWLTGGATVSTDNAQIGAPVVNIAPEVSGRVLAVYVAENQRVKTGDLLYRVDPEPYRIALLQAEAAVGQARLQIAQMQGSYSSRAADIGSATADVALAEENFRRQQELLGKGFTTRANYDAARAALASARAKRAVSAADAQAARAMLGASAQGGHPQVEAAIAAREQAALDLRRTEVRAPIDGIVAQTDKLQPGSQAVPMLSNISVVGTSGYWIDANFKETQLEKIRIGQPAEVTIDALPGRRYKAHVTGIGAGTGAEFSLLPAQNATGNWVKVTQRVPIRLALDEMPDRPLVSGWSAHVTVHVAP
jgi:membrane fusion protein (multidrug efflux system)